MIQTAEKIEAATTTGNDDLVTYWCYGCEKYKTYVFQPEKKAPVPSNEFVLLFEVKGRYTCQPVCISETVPVPGDIVCTNDHKRIEIVKVDWV